MTRIGVALGVVLSLGLLWPSCGRADGDYTEVVLGLGDGALNPPQGDYETCLLSVAFGQSLNDAISDKLNCEVPGEWSFRWMPYAAYVSSPNSNLELGCMASLKIGFPVSERVMPYIVGATGPMYTSQHTAEQSTQFNFVSFGGVGLQYKVDATQAIGAEYWVRHFSNASIKDPNDGIDTTHWMLSYTAFTD